MTGYCAEIASETHVVADQDTGVMTGAEVERGDVYGPRVMPQPTTS
jgi:hypothetical protein